MNAYSLQNAVSLRIPGYTVGEYLEAVNEAYEELWAETDLLNSDYFTDITTVSVTTQGREFDLRYNLTANLSAAVHPKIFQIVRIRVLMPGAAGWNAALPRTWSNSSEEASEQDASSPVYSTGPFYYQIFGRGLLRFARPFPVGTQFEIIYTIGYYDLAIVSAGTVTSSGTAVTGTGTFFTQLLPPDYDASYLPGTNAEADIEAEITVNNLTYRVVSITDDTHLTLQTAPAPAFAGATYQLGSVPDIPAEHHRLIADLGLRNLMARPSIAIDSTRLSFWAAKIERALETYRDHIVERQHQEANKRQRFPYGAVRRAWSTNVQ